MAELKKYLDTAALSALVTQIKAEDEKVKAYADKAVEDAGKLYDGAGSANTAETNAKAYTDALANGQVKTNKEDIATLKGDVNTAGSVAKAIADAKAVIDEDIDTVEAKADAAQAAADKAQGEVDALETLVGTLPEGTSATSVVDYVNVKTAGIATDAALGELNNQVSGLQTVVNGITADYLKGTDKTELSDAIKAEENRAKGVESGLRTDVDAIKGDYLKGTDKTELQGNIDEVAGNVATIAGDYLKASDKTELQGKIDAKVAQTDYDTKMEEIDGGIEGLQTQINTIMNNPDAEGAINSINEFTQYIADHGEIADGFRTDINKNKEDIAKEVKRAGDAESALSGRLDTLEAIDHDAYKAADTALKNELNGEIAKKADSSALTSAVQTLEAADTAIKGRLDTIEAQLGDGEGSVADLIAEAKQEAIDAAAADATTKAGNAESAAKGHADSLNTAMNARVEALEAIDHDHSNKGVLDGITSDKVSGWDGAAAKVHEHSNKTVLDGITSAKVTAWDAAEGNAKTYADGLNTTMQGVVDGIGSRVGTLESTITDKAEQDDLDAAVGRISKNETDIAALTSSVNSFTAITAAEVEALFA